MKYFYLEQKPNSNLFLLTLNLDKVSYRTSGSYNLLPARLLHMDYGEWLEFCKKSLGATVNRSKGAKYASVYFQNNAPTRKLVSVLDKLLEKNLQFS